VRLSPACSAAVKALGRREGATLFMTLLAAFQALLARCTGQDDLWIEPSAGPCRSGDSLWEAQPPVFHDGYVADGSGESLFVVHDGVLFTPDLSTGILRGMTRYVKVKFSGPQPTEEDRYRRLQELFRDYNSIGITSIADRDAVPGAQGTLRRYQQWNIDEQSVVSFGAISFTGEQNLSLSAKI